jgi:hypothetical protein
MAGGSVSVRRRVTRIRCICEGCKKNGKCELQSAVDPATGPIVICAYMVRK